MKIILSLLFSCLVLTQAGIPLTQCMSGRAQGTEPLTDSGSCGYGKWNSSTSPGTFTATVNEAFFSAGGRCGDCLEVTGPKGTTTVKITNFCSSNTCPADRPFFMLTPNAFAQISDEPLAVIYDAGFRRVSCESKGPIKAVIQNDTSDYYFKVLVWNNNVGISTLQIQGANMAAPALMTRQSSAAFSFSQAGDKVTLPATIIATSLYGDMTNLTITTMDKFHTFSFAANFPVPQHLVPGSPKTCTLSATPTMIYDDKLAEGYDTWSSKSYTELNVSDPDVHQNGKASMRIKLMSAHSYLALSRAGHFQTDYISAIKFSVRSDRVWSGMRVFFRSESAWMPSENITSEWSTYTVAFKNITHNSIEKSISFGSIDAEPVTMWLDDMSFILSPAARNASGGMTGDISTLNFTTTTPTPVDTAAVTTSMDPESMTMSLTTSTHRITGSDTTGSTASITTVSGSIALTILLIISMIL
eukprot:gene18006-21488_t